jgi:hypothetical protein
VRRMFSSKCAKNLTFFSKNQLRKMKKTIELTKETYAGIENNKKVPGVIYLDHETGRLVFKAFNRNKKRPKDKIICELETGWLKESAQRVKFFSSVKKTIPTSNIRMAMSRDMYEGMEVFESFRGVKK